jgi:hypothetical protein
MPGLTYGFLALGAVMAALVGTEVALLIRASFRDVW